jgi:hypothetical protein
VRIVVDSINRLLTRKLHRKRSREIAGGGCDPLLQYGGASCGTWLQHDRIPVGTSRGPGGVLIALVRVVLWIHYRLYLRPYSYR